MFSFQRLSNHFVSSLSENNQCFLHRGEDVLIERIDCNYNGDTQNVQKKSCRLFREHISASLNQLPL